MYQSTPYLGGLGISLKPPSWLRNLVGSVVRGSTVTVQTPAGPQTFDLGNPSDVAALKNIAAKVKVNVGGNRPAGPAENVINTVENIPGGWLTIAAVAAGIIFLPRLLRSR